MRMAFWHVSHGRRQRKSAVLLQVVLYRCFKEERRMAKAAAEGQVSRVGMVPSEPCHLRDLVA